MMNKFSDRIRNIDFLSIILVLILAATSLVIIQSTVYDGSFKLTRIVLVQALSFLIGFVVIGFIQVIDYRALRDMRTLLYVACLLLLLSVYIPGLGYEQFSSRAWINLGITTLQPSEFGKILFVFILADYLSEHRSELDNFKDILKVLLYSAPIIAIVLKEDLGSALVYIAIWVFMVFFAGINYKVLLEYVLLACASVPLIYAFLGAYQKQRIEAFLHPDNLMLPGNYQVWQSKVAIGSGGMFGKGLFQGTQKSLDFLPVQQSDFIFSVIVEELGFIGGLAVILVYLFLMIRFVKIMRNCIDLYGALLVVGFLSMFLFQIFENIAMTMGLMPVTGITLPLMSAGGTSAIASMIAIGVVLNVGANSKGINY